MPTGVYTRKPNTKTTRVCTNCRKELPLDENNFYPLKSKAHRYFTFTCRSCDAKRVRPERYKENKAYFVEYRKKHPKQLLNNVLKWQERNPEKREAHKLVHKALKESKLVKQPCGSAAMKRQTPTTQITVSH